MKFRNVAIVVVGLFVSLLFPQQLFAGSADDYRRAAEQGDAKAQYSLGWCYEDGNGVDKDMTEAVKWYRKAAEQGHAQAQHYLGSCYENGNGVGKDLVEAVKWYRKAAEQGYGGAKSASALEKLENATSNVKGAPTIEEIKSLVLGMDKIAKRAYNAKYDDKTHAHTQEIEFQLEIENQYTRTENGVTVFYYDFYIKFIGNGTIRIEKAGRYWKASLVD